MYIPRDYLNIYTTDTQAKQINSIILKYCNSDSIITDATAGIGGNTYFFCKTFKYVNVVELDNNLENTLRLNLSPFSNKSYYFCSFNIIKFLVKQDIIFIDPPWGGESYKQKKKISLYLDNIDVLDIVNSLYYFCKIICLKVPNNFNITSIDNKFWEHKIYNINRSKKCIYKIIIFFKPT